MYAKYSVFLSPTYSESRVRRKEKKRRKKTQKSTRAHHDQLEIRFRGETERDRDKARGREKRGTDEAREARKIEIWERDSMKTKKEGYILD